MPAASKVCDVGFRLSRLALFGLLGFRTLLMLESLSSSSLPQAAQRQTRFETST